jgi:hypothetical protein
MKRQQAFSAWVRVAQVIVSRNRVFIPPALGHAIASMQADVQQQNKLKNN